MKTFNIGDRVVTVKALTLGDLKKMQAIVNNEKEEEIAFSLIAHCSDITKDEIEALPISQANEINEISEYLADIIQGK